MPKRGMYQCPKCGYQLPTGKKIVLRIWVSESLEKIWFDFSKKYETNEVAFEELLKRANLIEGKDRAFVESPTKK